MWQIILNTSLISTPGTTVNYSDLGYQVLGKTIEVATKSSLSELASRRLWKPLGMVDTMFNPPESQLKRVTANRGIHGKSVDPVDQALGGIVGCDGVFSTARNVAAFMQMLLNGGSLNGTRILKEESVFELWKDQTPFAISDAAIGSEIDYLLLARKGLGFELPGTKYSHGGEKLSDRAFGKVGGTGTFIWIDPTHDLIVLYFTNHGQPVPFDSIGWANMIENTSPHRFVTQVIEAFEG